jgi:phage-related protein
MLLSRVLQWKVEILNKAVEEELLSLPKDMQARFLRISELLQSFGPQYVGMPHVRPLSNKLWEMRLVGREGIARALYVVAPGRRLVVLHTFIKKTQKTPRQALETAIRRLKEIT